MELKNRLDIVTLCEIIDGNGNGDPDMDNMPRTDPETMHGLMTDVSKKRKVRDIAESQGEKIFYRSGEVINNIIDTAHVQIPVSIKDPEERSIAARSFLLKTYYDIRTFGAVLNTGKKAGQVQGPIQVTFSRSIDPVYIQPHCITRRSVTTEKEAAEQIAKNGSITGTMGQKYTIPYALYRDLWTVTPAYAQQTGFSVEDLDKFLYYLKNMFALSQSSTRGMMSMQALYVFEHACPAGQKFALGYETLSSIVGRVQVAKKPDVIYPRKFSDYNVNVNLDHMPVGLTMKQI